MSKTSPVIRVLFVCTGNICRSPTAEGVFRHLVEQEGLGDRFVIGSAGTDAYHEGDAPDRRAVRIAKTRGVDIGHQRARSLTAKDYADYDYIFAMDGGHLHELQSRAPRGHSARIGMFLGAPGPHGRDEVPDPWYGQEKDFEEVYDLVLGGAKELLQKIRAEHGL